MISFEDLDNWFSHHPPRDEIDADVYERIRAAGKTFALVVLEETPPSADQTTAIRTIREAVMWANAAFACGTAR